MRAARLWAVVACAATAASAVEIADARLERRTLADPAAAVAEITGNEPTWLAWTAPGTAEATQACCFRRGWNERGCTLGGRDQGWGTSSDWPRLPGGDLLILAEIERGQPVRLRAVGSGCPIDGNGRRVMALDGVDPARSVDLLLRWARDPRSPEDVLDPALLGVLAHDLPDVALRVVALAEDPKLPIRVRKQALFWLADSGDPRALDEIEKILSR